MESLILKETKSTPLVHLDVNEGFFLLAGRSIPIDAESFYKPVLNWIGSLSNASAKAVEFNFRFEFFNIASSKRILFILYKLSDLHKSGVDVKVNWIYEKFDEDMLEIGQDYKMMIDNIPFTFKEFEKSDLKEVSKRRVINRA